MEVHTVWNKLSGIVQEVESKVKDMEQQARNEEAQLGKKRKNVFDAYKSQAHDYINSAKFVLQGSREGQLMLKRMCWVPSIERHCIEGQKLLAKGNNLVEEGLTNDKIRTRGEILPLEENQYIGETVTKSMESAHNAIKEGKSQCIGIYGSTGSGKTNLMKHLYNKVYRDKGFKAVFWATAPKLDSDHANNYHKAVQQCVADAMWIDLENDVHDEVRSAGRIMGRLEEIGGPGHAVLFLDNVHAEFPAYDLLGIPSLMTPSTSSSATAAASSSSSFEPAPVNCILVFNTLSKDVCNKMQCNRIFKVDLLGEKEAQDLFLHEVGLQDKNRQQLSSREQKIHEIAVEVANQCARMPLAITVIARSMVGIDDLCEWRHRLNDLMGHIASIDDQKDKILNQLKFGYIYLKDTTVQSCFIAAANWLGSHPHQLSKQEIIVKWKEHGIIGRDRRPEFADDQGHAILNQLERMCLLQVEVVPERDHPRVITMNKWIRKMATKVSMQRSTSVPTRVAVPYAVTVRIWAHISSSSSHQFLIRKRVFTTTTYQFLYQQWSYPSWSSL